MQTDVTMELATFIRAGYPALSINSAERVRAIAVIERAGWQLGHEKKMEDKGDNADFLVRLENAAKERIPGLPPVFTRNKGNAVFNIASLCALYRGPSALPEDVPGNAKTLHGEIGELLNTIGYPTITWDTVSGFSSITQHDKVENTTELYEAFALLKDPEAFPKDAIFVFNDVHEYMNNDPRYRAMFRHLVESNEVNNDAMHRYLLFLQPNWQVHADIVHAITPVEFSLPADEQLSREVDYISGSIKNPEKKTCPPELRWDLIKAMRGLTTVEAVNSLSYCVIKHGGFVPETVATMQKLTASALAKNDVLEIIPVEKLADGESIGGFDNYMKAIVEYKACYTEAALKVGLKRPKGCLLLGIPGTGKSLVAMATARLMHLPLIKYDFAAVFNSLVGQSESTQRQALRQVSARGPCVLLIDEADKAFSGIVGSSGDSGVSQRVFGRLLSWMANENDSAFVVMTMNRIVDSITGAQIVPIETLRAGRIETVWFTTFPNDEERMEIMAIHLTQNGAAKDTASARQLYSSRQWADLVLATNEYVGAELEQLVVKAVRMAFVNRGVLTPTYEEMLAGKSYVTPVAKLDENNIKAIDRFCKDRAVPVTAPKKAKTVAGRASRSLDVGAGDN